MAESKRRFTENQEKAIANPNKMLKFALSLREDRLG